MSDAARMRSEAKRDEEARRAADERPPLGGSWAVLYAAVLLNLVLLVVLFYLFTRAFR